MKELREKRKGKKIIDHIEGLKIILDGWGPFPKKLIIIEPGKIREYELVRTPNGNFLLN